MGDRVRAEQETGAKHCQAGDLAVHPVLPLTG